MKPRRDRPLRRCALFALASLCAACDPVADASVSVGLAIEAVSPDRVPSRGGVEVTVVGKNFAAGASVTLDGEPVLGLVRHNDHRLSFVAPALAVGPHQVELANPAEGATPVTHEVRAFAENVGFAQESVLQPDSDVESFLTGDIDGDGLDDVVSRKVCSQVVAYLNRGRGEALVKASDIASEHACRELIALTDLNGDGLADLVDHQGVFLATGAGAFDSLRPFFPQGGTEVRAAAVADFTGGAAPELAVFTDPRSFVLFGFDGSSLTVLSARPELRGSYYRPDMAGADVNGDGRADLVYRGEDSRLHVLLGPQLLEATGWSGPADEFEEAGLEVRDVTGDSKPDLVSAYGVYPGQGDGSFGPRQALAPLCSPVGVDRLIPSPHRSPYVPELLACDDGSARVGVFEAGQLLPYGALERPVGRTRVAWADLDGDPAPDLLYLAANGLVARFGSSNGSAPGELSARWGPMVPAVHDPSFSETGGVQTGRGQFGGGRRLALASRQEILLGEPLGAGARLGLGLPMGSAILQLAACDLDADGDDDVAARVGSIWGSPRPPDYLQLVYNDGDSLRLGERLADSPAGDPTVQQLLAGDVDADGRCDLVWVRYQDSKLVVATGAGFEVRPSTLSASGLKAIDLEGDGDLDLYGHHTYEPRLRLFRNDGAGNFALEQVPLGPAGEALRSFEDALLVPREDGALQLWLVAMPPAQGQALVLRAVLSEDSKVTEEARTTALLDADHPTLRLGDVNGDGLPDAVLFPRPAALSRGSEAAVVLSSKEGLRAVAPFELHPTSWYPIRQASWSTAEVLDLDGDGLADLVYGNSLQPGRLVVVQNASE